MPSKIFIKGGQRRTIEGCCGFSCKGSLREVEYKTKLHIKNCKICIENKTTYSESAFNSSIANHNGWGGLRADKIITSTHATLYENGQESIVESIK